LAKLLGVKVIEVSSMRPSLTKAVSGVASGHAEKWVEHLETDAGVLSTFATGHAAYVAKGKRHYLACWPSQDLLTQVMTHLCAEAKLICQDLPEHIRIRRRGTLTFAFNYGPDAYTLPKDRDYVLGSSQVAAYDIAVWKE
jgi:beta-galactosidase